MHKLICRNSPFVVNTCRLTGDTRRLSGFAAYKLIAVAYFADSLDFDLEKKTNAVYMDHFSGGRSGSL